MRHREPLRQNPGAPIVGRRQIPVARSRWPVDDIFSELRVGPMIEPGG